MKAMQIILLGSLFFPFGANAADWIFNYCENLTSDRFLKAAKSALTERRYKIEKETPNSIIGAQRGKKVEVTMTSPRRIVVRWVPGFGYRKDNWLKTVRNDVRNKVVGAIIPGVEWSINWCASLTVEEFHKAARATFLGRGFQIKVDDGNYVIGARKGKRILITMTRPGYIKVMWVPGFGYEKDNWLNALYDDMIWALEVSDKLQG